MSFVANPHIRLFVGAVMISFSPVFVNLVQVSPTASGFYRVLIGGVALGAFILLTGRKLEFTPKVRFAICGSATFFALDLWFWHRSIVLIGPGLSTLLANLQVFFMLVAGAILLRQKPTQLQLAAVPLALVGLTMMLGKDWGNADSDYRDGVAFGILTAVSYAGYLLCMRVARLEATHRVPLREVAAMSLIAAVLLGVSAAVERESLAIVAPADVVWLLAYGLLCHAVGLMFIASSLAKVAAAEVGIALLLQPSLSYAWDILFFGRSVAWLEALGAIVTLSAIFMGASARSQQPQGARQ